MTARWSYTGLSALPAWGLYDGDALIASVRAEDAYKARDLFRAACLSGTRVRRITKRAPLAIGATVYVEAA